MFSGKLGELEQALKMLPGIGAKTAQRLAMFLISQEKQNSLQLANAIIASVESYRNCQECNILTENTVCSFCESKSREDDKICIVENSQDVFILESTHEYRGKYFVLGSLLSPINGIGPDEINFPKLLNLIEKRNISEVILALNPSAEGETTISFLASQLKDKVNLITRLSTGLPFGGDIEYTSPITLSDALKRRYSVD